MARRLSADTSISVKCRIYLLLLLLLLLLLVVVVVVVVVVVIVVVVAVVTKWVYTRWQCATIQYDTIQ
jgi:hypothetical protein